SIIGNLLLVLGLQGKLLRISLVALVFNLIGNFILVPLVGFMGAAWMTLATEAIVLVQTSQLIAKTLEIKRPALGKLGRTALAAIVLGVGLGLLRIAGAPLGALIAAAAVAYPALLFGLGAVSVADLRLALRRGATA
ncbi:MAG TPA: polysaccharide biosynthesis C-terminal domain-containing protein, partial [Solirubrobacteraceae bacterium]